MAGDFLLSCNERQSYKAAKWRTLEFVQYSMLNIAFLRLQNNVYETIISTPCHLYIKL
jgi:hypothetical protein